MKGKMQCSGNCRKKPTDDGKLNLFLPKTRESFVKVLTFLFCFFYKYHLEMWYACQWDSYQPETKQRTIKLLQVTTRSSMMGKANIIEQALTGLLSFNMVIRLTVKSREPGFKQQQKGRNSRIILRIKCSFILKKNQSFVVERHRKCTNNIF